MRIYVALLIILTLIVLTVSCGEKGVPPGDDTPYSTLELVSGNNQTGPAGGLLLDTLLVRVVSSVGLPVPGDVVHFTQITQNGDGEILSSPRTTNSEGYADISYRLGSKVGVDTVKVVSEAVGDSGAVYFEFAVTAGAAGRLVKVSPLSLVSGTAGELLGVPFIVLVTDNMDNPVAGHTVYFKTINRCVVVTETSTEVPPETDTAYTTSDSNGLASATWILSINPDFIYPTFHQLDAIADFEDNTADTVNFLASAEDPGMIEYYDDIHTIFAGDCFDCHVSSGGYDIEDYYVDYYFELYRLGNLIPGDTNSLLVFNSKHENHKSKFGHFNFVEEDIITRWVGTDMAAPGSSGMNNYTNHMKNIIDASCVTCHSGGAPQNNYSMSSHLDIRGPGLDAVSNAIPGGDTSLVVQKMQQRHQWQSLDPDSATAAILADSISSWIVDDFMREY
jgi:hypothetical protein